MSVSVQSQTSLTPVVGAVLLAWGATVALAATLGVVAAMPAPVVPMITMAGILLPMLAYPIAAVMIGAGVLSGLGRSQPIGVRAWWLTLGLGMVVLVETALYLTGTPLGADYIQGTQGRYFLPALPLILLAIAPQRAVLPAVISAERVMLIAACLLHVIALVTVVDSFWVHGFTTHHGLPPFDHDPGGMLRMLLLPSPRW